MRRRRKTLSLWGRILLVLATGASIGLSIGCGDSPDGVTVSREMLGEQWPFTVDEGTLRCDGPAGVGAVVFAAPDGTEYGINGTAQGQGYPPIDPIWRDDPEFDELKVSVGPLIDRGLALCR